MLVGASAGPSSSMLGNHLVHDDMAIVVHDLLRETAVVVLVTNTPTATRKKQIVDDESFIIMVIVALAANDLPARRFLTIETRYGRRSHRYPPCSSCPQYAGALSAGK
jgi:hypothetical protein